MLILCPQVGGLLVLQVKLGSILIQPSLGFFIVVHSRPKPSPELGAVVVLNQVTEFMEYQIGNDRRGEEQDLPMKVQPSGF